MPVCLSHRARAALRAVLRPLLALLFATCAALRPAPATAAAAECPQVTTWSSQDSSFFPVDRVTRVDHGNVPGPFYFDLDNVQVADRPVTYFSLVASPAKTVDQRFANALSVALTSFASAADAAAVFERERANFNRINPFRWGYKVLAGEGLVMSYYADDPGEQQLNYLAVHRNAVMRLTLRSASATENLLAIGVAQMGDRIAQARALIDKKCNLNSEPEIALLAPGRGSFASEFQAAMAGGTLTITASDGDGLGDLDWGSFRLFVAGVDKTAHALQVVDRLASQGRVKYTETPPYRVTYELRLDRRQLMGEHNLFNIAWNGEWPVELRLCDRKGACATSRYALPFGPFVHVPAFTDWRCNAGFGDDRLQIDATWGNNGYDAVSNFYLLLGPDTAPWASWTRSFWSLTLEEPAANGVLRWLDAGFGMRPVFGAAPVQLPSGALEDYQTLMVSRVATVRDGPPAAIGAGAYTLAVGAIDLELGWYRVETRHVGLCAPR